MRINETERCSKGNQCHNRETKIVFGSHNGKQNKTCEACRTYHNEFFKKNGNKYRHTRAKYYQNKIVSERKRMKFNHFLKKYRVSEKTFLEMLKDQKNACEICLKEFVLGKDGYPECDIDHDHKTGKARGLLCRSCNVALGRIENHADSIGIKPIELIERLIAFRESTK